MADSSATFISWRASRAPERLPGERGVQVALAGRRRRGPGRAASAASTRGSSWPASATTSSRPGGGDHGRPDRLGNLQRASAARRPPARHDTARHVLRVEAPVPHPLLPPGPSVRRVQARELAVPHERLDHRCSCRRSSCRRVEVTGSPARRRARSTSACESTLRPGSPRMSATSSARACSTGGRAAAPAGWDVGRAPSSSVSSSSCTSALHGRPACVISTAARHEADSAATSSPSPGSSARRRAIRSSWPAYASARACALRGGVAGPGSNRAGCPMAASAAPARAAVTAAAPAWSPSIASNSASVAATSWQRPIRTPARTRAGYAAATSARTQRGPPPRSASATAAARSGTGHAGPDSVAAGPMGSSWPPPSASAASATAAGRSLGGSTVRSCLPAPTRRPTTGAGGEQSVAST